MIVGRAVADEPQGQLFDFPFLMLGDFGQNAKTL